MPGMDSDDPDFIVVGEKVALGPLRRDLAATYRRGGSNMSLTESASQSTKPSCCQP